MINLRVHRFEYCMHGTSGLVIIKVLDAAVAIVVVCDKNAE